MGKPKPINIALTGNPNSGKSSLFNQLTGLNQKIGNFPGVTVDKRSGTMLTGNNKQLHVIDLPGTYSIYPKSKDEEIVTEILINLEEPDYPDVIVVIADVSNLKRNLLFFTQVKDLGIPTILVMNMVDLADRMGKDFDLAMLREELGVPIFRINARTGEGIKTLKNALSEIPEVTIKNFLDVRELVGEDIRQQINGDTSNHPYLALHHLIHKKKIDLQSAETIQTRDTTLRYGKINRLVEKTTVNKPKKGLKIYTNKIDLILTHKIYGYAIFIAILFLMFQAIFAWATWPMDLIDLLFVKFSIWLGATLPSGVFTELLKDGVVPGIGGVLIFIPQIAILFAFIAVLEESGYMARVVFLMDKIMRKVGLSGRSVVPLISGVACAIPAIMATRNIEHWKERLITIFVVPLISCSARLPVYTILIALVIPNERIYGVINLQGLVLLGLYLVGFVAAIGSAYLLMKIMRSSEKSFLIMELPTYKMPRWKNVGLTIFEKVKTFSFTAGKIIVAISIVLWVLSSYGPGNEISQAKEIVQQSMPAGSFSEAAFKNKVSSFKLEHSYAAYLGRAIEPIIKPLGFNWKIGIALITSFAAREVFVGTMATLYSIESGTDDTVSIKERMLAERDPVTGGPFFTLPLGLSLMIFYAFAMQCMSTLAIIQRETKGWKWPILITIYMSALAYVSSLVVFKLFS